MPMPGHVNAIAHSMPMPHANANVISFQVNQLNQSINQPLIKPNQHSNQAFKPPNLQYMLHKCEL